MTPDLESASDDVLIAAIAAGEVEALTRLFRRRQADVYRFALHMTGAPALADDVTQDVFLIVMYEKGFPARHGRPRHAGWSARSADDARQHLEILLMTRHNDPRSGETTYTVTNIIRAEPQASLFDVPADYTMLESPYRAPAR